MKTYKEILENIFSAYPMYHKVGTSAYKEGLENIEALLDIVGNPQRMLKCVHVAGTNGKGSVSSLLSSYFQELGYKTGLYTSPHLVDFRERIRIDGTMITEKEVIDFFAQYQKQFDKIEPSFFEIATALAFWHFAKEKVDYAVVEVGLGGRLDATNVITPLLSVITNISLEHTQLLGNTIAKIAFEKAGIIKDKTPIVIGEFHPESFPVFEDVAVKHNAPLFLADANYKTFGNLDRLSIEDSDGNKLYTNILNPLDGAYQRMNIVTFVQAAKLLDLQLHAEKDVIGTAIENVVRNTGIMGRWQLVSERPHIICDVGHNVAGLTYTMQSANMMSTGRTVHIVFGMVNDKDIDNVAKLLPKHFRYYVCRAAVERALKPEILAEKLQRNGNACDIYPTVVDAIQSAKAHCEPNDLIIITGSCFVVGEALEFLQ